VNDHAEPKTHPLMTSAKTQSFHSALAFASIPALSLWAAVVTDS